MMRPLTVLRKVKAIFSKPNTWVQGWFAKDAKGETCPSSSEEAVCYCIFGAMNKVADQSSVDGAAEALRETVGDRDLVAWNDTPGRTIKQIRAAVNKTIKRLENKCL